MALVFPTVFNLFLSASHKKHGGSVAASNERPLSIAEWVQVSFLTILC
jgi:hypothetical protein